MLLFRLVCVFVWQGDGFLDIDEICDAWALITSKAAVTTTLRQSKAGVDVTAKPEESTAAAPAAASAAAAPAAAPAVAPAAAAAPAAT